MISLNKFLFILLIPILAFSAVKNANMDSSYIVMEKNSKRVLDGENIDDQMLVASTAKILTAITAIENYDLEEEIEITNKDINEEGSKVYLKENDKIKRIDLIYALMLRSANDAASALSFNNSEEFLYLMNETAKKIGMKNSVFENASGLDEREYNLSTAYDMALLSAYAANNEVFKEIAGAHTYKCKTKESNYSWTNKHKLVKNEEDFLWGKTGYTKKAKRILVSNYLKDDMDIIIVTINKSDDWNLHKSYIDKLDDYDFLKVYNKGIYDTKFDVEYYISVDNDIIIPLKKDEYDNVMIKFILYPDRAIMKVYIKNTISCEYNLKVYNKDTFNLDEKIISLNEKMN